MTKDTQEQDAPFYAVIGARSLSGTTIHPSRAIQIVRETPTLFVEGNGDRWRKKDRRLVGSKASAMYDPRLILPGEEGYSEAFVKDYLAEEKSRPFQKVLRHAISAKSVEAMAPFIRELASMLDEYEGGQE